MELEQQIRQEHPDWTNDQVQAEVQRRQQAPPPPPPPPPAPQPGPTDAAFAEMRRRAEAAERKAKEMEDAEAERTRKAAEEQGEYQKLYEEQKARADGLQQQLDELKAQIDSDKETRRTEQLVNRIATDLKFRRADEALAFLPADVDRSDEDAVRKALEKVAEDRSHLVDGAPAPPTGRPPGGGGPTPPTEVTAEQLKGMTPQQIAALDPEVVNKALAAAT